jgi:hypothetical protein
MATEQPMYDAVSSDETTWSFTPYNVDIINLKLRLKRSRHIICTCRDAGSIWLEAIALLTMLFTIIAASCELGPACENSKVVKWFRAS